MNRAPLNYDEMVERQAHLPHYNADGTTSYIGRTYKESRDFRDGMPYGWNTFEPKKYPEDNYGS